MGKTLKDGKTPTMPEVRKLFPGVGKPHTAGSGAVKQVRKIVRESSPQKRKEHEGINKGENYFS